MSSRHIISRSRLDRRPVPRGRLAAVYGTSPANTPRASMIDTGFQRSAASVVSDAAGVGELRFGPPDRGLMWRLSSVLVQVSGSPGSACSIYVGQSVESINLVAGTPRGDLDTADRDPPVYVPAGQLVIVRWVSAGVGNLCTAAIQYVVSAVV